MHNNANYQGDVDMKKMTKTQWGNLLPTPMFQTA